MDWNRDGKVDFRDAVIYHEVLTKSGEEKSTGSKCGAGKRDTAKSTSDGGGAIIAITIVLGIIFMLRLF